MEHHEAILYDVAGYWLPIASASPTTRRATRSTSTPREVTVFAQPLASLHYWRGSLCGIVSTLVTAFSQRAFVRDLPWSSRTPHEASYRVSWV